MNKGDIWFDLEAGDSGLAAKSKHDRRRHNLRDFCFVSWTMKNCSITFHHNPYRTLTFTETLTAPTIWHTRCDGSAGWIIECSNFSLSTASKFICHQVVAWIVIAFGQSRRLINGKLRNLDSRHQRTAPEILLRFEVFFSLASKDWEPEPVRSEYWKISWSWSARGNKNDRLLELNCAPWNGVDSQSLLARLWSFIETNHSHWFILWWKTSSSSATYTPACNFNPGGA